MLFYDRLGYFQAMPNLEEDEFNKRITALIAAKQLVADEKGFLQTVAPATLTERDTMPSFKLFSIRSPGGTDVALGTAACSSGCFSRNQ
ncbi:hypothetical protein OM428_11920 [Enterococcus gallinarum]|nr:hypothetical protein [Enterococcus gallinarum]